MMCTFQDELESHSLKTKTLIIIELKLRILIQTQTLGTFYRALLNLYFALIKDCRNNDRVPSHLRPFYFQSIKMLGNSLVLT
ncbi:hypothetical protein V202x_32420 [Gimesia aquarii]|uniref:Uncharacterized protein n=1 Tax=Gimesia aquarii TaxID=2527964 RepID=A0A517WX55_9PLAN|nr:hypothetical protein V202x_32420 [Gimesia aquarii]